MNQSLDAYLHTRKYKRTTDFTLVLRFFFNVQATLVAYFTFQATKVACTLKNTEGYRKVTLFF